MNDFTVQLKNSFCPDHEAAARRIDFETDVRPVIENPSKMMFETFYGDSINEVVDQLKKVDAINTANYILYKIILREDFNEPHAEIATIFRNAPEVKWGHATSSGQASNVVLHLLTRN
jgi:hypothetical protein